MFMDAIHYHVRSEGQIVKKAVYIAIGIDLSGKKDVLGMWVGENESAKYWATVLNSLHNRGVEDIFIVCTDNLTGFSNAIEAVFPKTDIQNCIIRQLRNSGKYVSYKDLKSLMADLKQVICKPLTKQPQKKPWIGLQSVGNKILRARSVRCSGGFCNRCLIDLRLLAIELGESEHLLQFP